MKWKKYTLKTTVEAEDLISTMMMEQASRALRLRTRFPSPTGRKSKCL